MNFLDIAHGDGLEILKELDGDGVEFGVVANRLLDKVADTRCSKVVFVDGIEQNSKGFYMEIKVEECLSGFIPSLAFGFTILDDTTGPTPEIIKRRACEINQDTMVVGYSGTVHLGDKSETIEWNPGTTIVPRGLDILGILLAKEGDVVIYHDKKEVCRFDLSEKIGEDTAHDRYINPPMGCKVFGIVDVYGGPQRVRIFKEPKIPEISAEIIPAGGEEGGGE